MRGDLPQPDRDRLSTLTALVILSYALIRIVVLPIFSAELTFAGLIFEFKVDTRLIMLTLAAALTVAGADWAHCCRGRLDAPFPPILEIRRADI